MNRPKFWRGLKSDFLSPGRPLGSADFIEEVEKLTARVLRRQKPGPKKQ